MSNKEINIKKGLDIPMSGMPVQSSPEVKETEQVALLGGDYHGLKPAMAVEVGDQVKKGSVLFAAKQNEGVVYTSPASGKVIAINRGARRKLVSVVVAVDGKDTQEKFSSFSTQQLAKIKAADIAKQLQLSGLWCALRTRPFSKIPATSSQADAIFINVMAEDKHSADPQLFLQEHTNDFIQGVKILAALTKEKGRIFVCHAPHIQLPNLPQQNNASITTATFSGKYPASLSGTHMHFLYPAGRGVTNWWINYQDTAAIGRLFLTGELMNQRMISIAGPGISNPRPLITSLGANVDELTAGELQGSNNRLISGSVLNGAIAGGAGEHDADVGSEFLGRYHLQLTALNRGDTREFMGWISPGLNKFSVQNIYVSKLLRSKLFNFTSTTNGSERAMVPMGTYEKIMPHNMLPTQLLRSLLVEDIEMAERLGCLELDEEDLALCSFVCPGKYEYGEALRENLTRIEKENWDT